MQNNPFEQQLSDLDLLLLARKDGLSLAEIARLRPTVPRRTLQRRLQTLVERGAAVLSGTGRATRYLANPEREGPTDAELPAYAAQLPFSSVSRRLIASVRRPLPTRLPASYDDGLLDRYQPNVTAYLPADVRDSLREMGRDTAQPAAAGTYAKSILGRLLIDLSWASAHLEGNTYTRLDTERLIAFGETAEGRDAIETQMILNHKAAIEYLVDHADRVDCRPPTLYAIHALLADGLLADPTAAGRLRKRAVGIGGSTYLPMAMPQRLAQMFALLAQTADAIDDPIEQGLFLLIHLPYLQPFEDINKRTSRLAANIGLIRHNLVPLAFLDVPRDAYIDAILALYEHAAVEPMVELFVWAYERTCQHYAAVHRQLVPPEPLRIRYRPQLGHTIAAVVRRGLPTTEQAVQVCMPDDVAFLDRERLGKIALLELAALHEGNGVRFGLEPSEVRHWLASASHPTLMRPGR